MEIPQIKQQLLIQQVLSHYKLATNKNEMLACPFHENDKTPSLKIYTETNTFYCFSCGATGDQIQFIELHEKCTKHESILKAKTLAGLPAETNVKAGNIIPTKTIKPMQKISKPDRVKALTAAFSFFTRSINYGKSKALGYLESRALNHKKTTVGYDAHSFHKSKETTPELKKLYLDIGLLKPDMFGRPGNYHGHFDKCIVFPMLDKDGNIIDLYGRHTEKEEHRYLPGNHQGIYPGYPEPGTEVLIITESIIDAATLLQIPAFAKAPAGRNEIKKAYAILAMYGTKGLTMEHQEAIKQLKKLKEIILFLDGDKPGRKANQLVAGKLKALNNNVKISIVNTPGEEDINSMLVKYDEDAIKQLLSEREFFLLSEKTENQPVDEKQKTAPLSPKQKKDILPEPNIIATSTSKLQPVESGEAGTKLFHRLNTANPDYIVYENGELTISLWGGIELHQVSRLRATLHIQLKNNVYAEFRDTIDLYSFSQVDRLIKQASEKLEISSTMIGKAITELTRELEQHRQHKRAEKRRQEEERIKEEKDSFTSQQIKEAGEFINQENLTEKTYEMFNHLGLVGQQKNGLLLFFIFLTRFFKNPLHAIVMGSSGAGKTHLLKGVAAVIPKQHIHFTTSLSENTLYYTPPNFLKHKILLQEDLDGSYNALLPLRELMSNQAISRFSTKTNSKTGDSKQIYLHVEGPVCVAGATTKEKIFEDNANRSFLIQLEENPEHENNVLDYQGKEAAGLVDLTKRQEFIDLLKASQLLIKPMEVIIPFATELELPPHVFKKMRTKIHYLALIKSITLWNQRNREKIRGNDGNTYLVSTLEDVEWANFLSKEILLRKSDELNGKLRQFFESLKNYIQKEYPESKVFYAKDIRKIFRLHPMKLKRYLDELEQMSYIKCKNKNQKTGHEYEITVWDDYENLKKGIDILDTILEKLKNKYKDK